MIFEFPWGHFENPLQGGFFYSSLLEFARKKCIIPGQSHGQKEAILR